MLDILQVADRLAKTNVQKVLVKILNKRSIQKFITDLNTKVQLVEFGEDNRGVQLSAIGGIYAVSTLKRSKTRKKNRSTVNLKDTGDYHKSFKVIVKPNANFIIDSDPIKNGVSLFERYGDDVEGLQPENMQLVLDRLEIEFYKEVFRGL